MTATSIHAVRRSFRGSRMAGSRSACGFMAGAK
jgi:hypothetical protein